MSDIPVNLQHVDYAFILGTAGTVLAVASLAWQVATWRSDGARLRVAFTWGIPLGSGDQRRGITVTNKGRAATIVSGVTSRLPDGRHIPLVADSLNQITFPHQIRPGETITAYYQPAALERALEQNGLPLGTRLTPQALSGDTYIGGEAVAIS